MRIATVTRLSAKSAIKQFVKNVKKITTSMVLNASNAAYQTVQIALILIIAQIVMRQKATTQMMATVRTVMR